MASSYSPHCKTYLLTRLQNTLLTLDRAIGASIARLVLYVQAVDAYTSETVVDINRKSLDSHIFPPPFGNQLSESITIYFYWSMLECGLALLAACLPPTSYLITHLNMQTVSNKVRRCLSIRRLRPIRDTPNPSRGFNTSQNQCSPYGERDKHWNASHAGILRSSQLELEQLHIEDVEIASPRDGIVIGPI